VANPTSIDLRLAHVRGPSAPRNVVMGHLKIEVSECNQLPIFQQNRNVDALDGDQQRLRA